MLYLLGLQLLLFAIVYIGKRQMDICVNAGDS